MERRLRHRPHRRPVGAPPDRHLPAAADGLGGGPVTALPGRLGGAVDGRAARGQRALLPHPAGRRRRTAGADRPRRLPPDRRAGRRLRAPALHGRRRADGRHRADRGGGARRRVRGWFDAGDFLKFTHTTSYVVGQLLTAVRDTPPVPGLPAEADHGLDWLDRMWDGPDGVLYAQVGLGSGNARLRGDHDMWRLPEEDDALSVRPGDPDYLVKHRPVFRANPPGDPVSPNLAGRVAAAFALAAQVRAEEDPEAARRWLDKAAEVYARADTDPHGRLFTTVPASYYREDSWRDDMEWAAVELARSARELGDGRSVRWQREAVGWAKAYLQSGERGTLDVSDVSALAHADLLSSPGLDGDTRNALEADLRRQLAEGTRQAARDPFGAGAVLTEFDAVPRTFGLVATAGLYARVTRDHRFDAFASRQRGWVFGANPWGTSFVIGAGETYPHCPEHQVANLALSRTGRGDILRGAVVNGPNKAELLGDLERFDSMRPCSAEPSGHRWSDFDGHGAGYVDDVAAWQTVEPADDFTATALLALSLTADAAVTELR
ncbi:glycoside hydrolase family 9 protein [Streptomyces sp. PSKA30]|uniref:glycoside hydrolase family 9 protein n=1 Tax=Streptomyces sp. PSKA30 TaxID=2874597 RepID=UPI001CD12B32|nr:glycoside hydrolase family 9 protein [Streptomyces sp. PSKA30]MBZ9645302.1 glycoside hydrolase family 9 protein [Streptomyces sp. PSKA30]